MALTEDDVDEAFIASAEAVCIIGHASVDGRPSTP